MLKANTLVEQFRAWLDTKTGPYNFQSTRDCAMAQFLKAEYPGSACYVGPYSVIVDDVSTSIPAPLQAFLYYGLTFEKLKDMLDNPGDYPRDEEERRERAS